MTTRVFYHKETGAPVQLLASAQTKPTYQEVICYQELTDPYDHYVMEKRQFFAEYVKEFAELPVAGRKQLDKRQDLPDRQPLISKGEVLSEEKTESEPEGDQEHELTEKMMAFLDADTFHEKLRILEDMEGEVNEFILNNLAVSLDIPLENDVDAYAFILSELRIRAKYESERGNRL